MTSVLKASIINQALVNTDSSRKQYFKLEMKEPIAGWNHDLQHI